MALIPYVSHPLCDGGAGIDIAYKWLSLTSSITAQYSSPWTASRSWRVWRARTLHARCLGSLHCTHSTRRHLPSQTLPLPNESKSTNSVGGGAHLCLGDGCLLSSLEFSNNVRVVTKIPLACDHDVRNMWSEGLHLWNPLMAVSASVGMDSNTHGRQDKIVSIT